MIWKNWIKETSLKWSQKKLIFQKKDSRDALETAFELMEQALLKGEEVNITNFGVFTPKTRASRDGTHPKKHTRIKIEQSRSITFRLSKSLKEKLNS